jgi:hypothetical protein
MTNDQIQEIALANGFKLKPQPDGTMALNPYVFDFARALLFGAKLPPYPESSELRDIPTLSRWGIKWQGPENPICVPMNDGYWTPWNLAEKEINALIHDNAQLYKSLNSETSERCRLEDENSALKRKILHLEGAHTVIMPSDTKSLVMIK